jgi:hypothetical protein
MSDPLAKIDDDSMVRWGNVRFEFGRLQYELNVALTELARLTPAPGCSLVVSVGVDGTTSTHQLEQVGWADDARDLTSKPGQFYGWALTDERKVTGFDEPVYRLVAVPVRDPQEPHDG